MNRYRFVWKGGSVIHVAPVSVDFGKNAVFVRDFDRFADLVTGPFCFPRGIAWETNMDDFTTFKLFYRRRIARCVKSYRRALVAEL